jgi:hypothetical protein
MRLTVDEYIHKCLEQVTFEIYVSAVVKETGQTFLTIYTYRLRRPDLQLKVSMVCSLKLVDFFLNCYKNEQMSHSKHI